MIFILSMNESYFMTNSFAAQGHSFRVFSDLFNDGALESIASFTIREKTSYTRESINQHIDIWKILETTKVDKKFRSKFDHIVVISDILTEEVQYHSPELHRRYWFMKATKDSIVSIFSKNYQLFECKNIKPSMCNT